MSVKTADMEHTRNKFTQVYRHLQALHQLRNPVKRSVEGQHWLLWCKDLPHHPSIQMGAARTVPTGLDSVDVGRESVRDEEEFILKVTRPEFPAIPQPPDVLIPWLQDGWEDHRQDVVVYDTKDVQDEDGQTHTESFLEDPDRDDLLEKWKERRQRWVEETERAVGAMKIFERLYALYASMERDAEQIELVFGDGLLTWVRQDGNVHHPVLLQRVQLHFEPSVPEFTVLDSEHPPELYTALFRVMTDVSAGAISNSIEEVDRVGWHPLGDQGTTDFLKRLVAQLSPHGKMAEGGIVHPINDIPFIERSPVFFLRKRTLGYSIALEKILDDLQSRESLPKAVASIMGILEGEQDRSNHDILPMPYDVNGEDEYVLLSKEANAEQLQVAQRLERNDAVLVQGPPGTGKTHTIANLLGHLLAQGKSVLVTSHTTKALHVLREKVVPALQPLCVAMLDDDQEGRQQLEGAIDAITERLAHSDVNVLEREANRLQQQRTELLSELRDLRQRLKLARSDEYRAVVVDGKEYSPSDAARRIAESPQNNWIPSPVRMGVPLPLSEKELTELYVTNAVVTVADERELVTELPSPDELLDPSTFRRYVEESKRLEKQDLQFRRELWGDGAANPTPEKLGHLLDRVTEAVAPLKNETEWNMVTLSAGREGDLQRQPWIDLLSAIEALNEQAASLQPTLIKLGPELPAGYEVDRLEQLYTEILERLEQKGKIGRIALLLNREWKVVINQSKVNNKTPKLIGHFEALRHFVRLQAARLDLVRRWQRQVAALAGPVLDEQQPEPEKIARQFSEVIAKNLKWYDETWHDLEKDLVQQGLKWDSLLSENQTPLLAHGQMLRLRDVVLHKLPAVIEAQMYRLSWEQVEGHFQKVMQKIEVFGTSSSEVVTNLHQAVLRRDANSYQMAFSRLAELHIRHEALKRRNDLLGKIEDVAPVWALKIRNRQGVHGGHELPGNVKDAWLWRQLHDELEERAQTSMEGLQAKINKCSEELRAQTAVLVENRAWAAQVRRTTVRQQQALQGWKSLIKKAGKRTGTRAPRLLAEARRLMPTCQTAVPVWIMPLSRVVENFDPAHNQFDVVIVDEASQSDVMALTALYMGSQVVVVGDDEQVSPDPVGKRNDEVQQLIDTYLTGIPNPSLYDGQSSVYDLAKTSFSMVGLKEHFRCVEPIIQFSNHLSYGGAIKPLRDASDVLRRPHTVAYRVEGATSSDKTNELEAKTIASLMKAAIEQPEYQSATFGVISMVGDEQAELIDRLLRRVLSATEYRKRQIRCGNPSQFQGDERDVMFLSMIYTPTGEGPIRLLSDPGDRFKKRFNVASSRARDQMWVVHSVDPEIDLKEKDIRRRLIMHARDPFAITRSLEVVTQHAESVFEEQVIRLLIQKGYRVIPQWPVGAYRIDIVVQNGNKRLAVECDGDRWHHEGNLEEDMARQAILERLGWRFVRIRGSQFFRNQEKAMESVFARLEALGIQPDDSEARSSSEDSTETELHERITRRAAEIQREWEESGELLEFVVPKKKRPRKNNSKTVEVTAEGGSSDKTNRSQPTDLKETEQVSLNLE